MNYDLSFDCAGVVVLLCIYIIHSTNRNKVILQTKAFKMVTMCALLAGIFDILDIYGNENVSSVSNLYLNLTSYGYFIFLNSSPFGYATYIVSLKKNSVSLMTKKEKCFLIIPIAFLYLVVASNVFTHVIFQYDSQGNYSRGKFQFILYAVSLYYMIFGVVYAYSIRHNLSKIHRVAVNLFIVIGFGSSVVQMFIPDLLISVFAISICIMIIILAFQKQAEGIDPKMKIYDANTFDKLFNLRISGNGKGIVYLLYIEDIKFLNQAIGLEKVDGYLSEIAKYLNTLSKNKTFYLGGTVFAIMGDADVVLPGFAGVIKKRFEEPWVYDNAELYMNCKMLKINIPTDAATLESIQMCKEYIKSNKNSEEWYFEAKNTALTISKRRLEVEKAIKNAIENDSFEVYYQPIYSTSNKKIMSAEALLRLKDPELGFIPPDEFITIAEKNGMIVQVGEIVFEKVCRFMNESNLEQLGIKYIEVNLSVVQCIQDTLADFLLKTMRRFGIHSSRINLEITETAANSSPKMLIRNMKKLFDNGISFSLDDFGTGYANMSAIMDLPLDMIKLDKKMIPEETGKDKSGIVFLNSVAMIKQMDMKIVAEGIETEKQKEMMEQAGIDFLQGYFFSKPIPEEEFLCYVEKFNKI